MREHHEVSALAGKRMKRDNNPAIKQHHLICIISFNFDNFSILASNSNDFKVTLIDKDQPPLNKSKHSLPLGLFND